MNFLYNKLDKIEIKRESIIATLKRPEKRGYGVSSIGKKIRHVECYQSVSYRCCWVYWTSPCYVSEKKRKNCGHDSGGEGRVGPVVHAPGVYDLFVITDLHSI